MFHRDPYWVQHILSCMLMILRILQMSMISYCLLMIPLFFTRIRISKVEIEDVVVNELKEVRNWFNTYARVKGHLEPTHLKSSPLFTFPTKSLGQDSPSIHFFSKIIGSRFTTSKIKLSEDSPSWFVFSRSRFTLK